MGSARGRGGIEAGGKGEARVTIQGDRRLSDTDASVLIRRSFEHLGTRRGLSDFEVHPVFGKDPSRRTSFVR